MHFGLSNPYCHSLYLQHPGKVLIRCGFGCDPNFRLPIRLPAYTLPVLELARTLNEQGIEVDIEFYFAEHFSKKLLSKGPNDSRVWLWTNRAERYLKAFLTDRGYRRSSNQGLRIILRDRPLMPQDWEILSPLVDCLEKYASLEVRQFATRRGGRVAFEYMAAHSAYMYDPLEALRDFESLTPSTVRSEGWNTVIMVGGAAERVFYDARQTLMRYLPTHADWNSLQVFSEIGAQPTYHLTKGESDIDKLRDLEELTLDQLLSGMARQPERDLRRLLADCGEDYSGELLNLNNPKQRKTLEQGWEKLQSIAEAVFDRPPTRYSKEGA